MVVVAEVAAKVWRPLEAEAERRELVRPCDLASAVEVARSARRKYPCLRGAVRRLVRGGVRIADAVAVEVRERSDRVAPRYRPDVRERGEPEGGRRAAARRDTED